MTSSAPSDHLSTVVCSLIVILGSTAGLAGWSGVRNAFISATLIGAVFAFVALLLRLKGRAACVVGGVILIALASVWAEDRGVVVAYSTVWAVAAVLVIAVSVLLYGVGNKDIPRAPDWIRLTSEKVAAYVLVAAIVLGVSTWINSADDALTLLKALIGQD